MDSKYKYKIDKKALTRFFTEDNPDKECMKAVRLVALTVLIKHYAKYVSLKDDLISQCFLKLIEIKPRYDLSYSAYNYAYTACRNEIGNYINKHREVLVEDILPISNASVVPTTVELPPEINKFKRLLTGEDKFETLEISVKDAVNLSVFIEHNQPTRQVTPPAFMQSYKDLDLILYKILVKL